MLTLPHIVRDNFEDIYIEKLKGFQEHNTMESIQDTFVLTNPLNNVVHNKAREFNQEFTQAYADWIWAGEIDIRKLDHLNVNAKKFDNEYKGRFASYGPRVLGQVQHVLHELKTNPDSRRACIMILDERDQVIAEGLRDGKTRCEYPCTMGITFFIRDGELHCQATMRSNNYVLTVCIDVYLFTTFQKWVASALGLPVGVYFHTAVSGHIFGHELPLVEAVLESDRKNPRS